MLIDGTLMNHESLGRLRKASTDAQSTHCSMVWSKVSQHVCLELNDRIFKLLKHASSKHDMWNILNVAAGLGGVL